MPTKGFYKMTQVNDNVCSNIVLHNRESFQLAHAEFDPMMSFVILILLKEGEKQANGIVKMTKIGFSLVNAFCNLEEDVYYKLSSVEKTSENDKSFHTEMINFTIKIEKSKMASDEIVYLTEDVLFERDKKIDFHIKVKNEDKEKRIQWNPMQRSKDTGGHMCKGKGV
ncbi:hypothetical protein [Tenacibaculum xiamenense]|uniref:hypothetical protein n=1 Tax=Tenacibaculum xiamenense TaxID=1261553 RepID=UPI00389606E4